MGDGGPRYDLGGICVLHDVWTEQPCLLAMRLVALWTRLSMHTAPSLILAHRTSFRLDFISVSSCYGLWYYTD